MNRRHLVLNILGPIVSFVGLIGVWWAIVTWGHVASYIAPTPLAAFSSITRQWSTISSLAMGTIRETIWGFLAGALLGIAFGVVMSKLRFLQRVLYPILILTQAVPIVAIASPLVLLMGFNLGPKIVIVAWIVFFPVTVNILDGLTHIDPDLLTLSRVLGAKRWRTFWFVEVPAVVTPLFSGLKIGATYAVTGAIIGEMSASDGQSLALFQHNAIGQLDAATVYGTTIVMTVIGISWFLLMVMVEYISTPWARRSTARRPLFGDKNVVTTEVEVQS
jgi:ABC-type nitrate/sulfonate/bicarbonate transport system permease component